MLISIFLPKARVQLFKHLANGVPGRALAAQVGKPGVTGMKVIGSFYFQVVAYFGFEAYMIVNDFGEKRIFVKL